MLTRAIAGGKVLRKLTFVSAAFAAGVALGSVRAEATPEAEDPYRALAQLGRVLVAVENHYVDPVERKKVLDGAIKGMVDALDPHSSYMPPEEWKQFQSDTEGKFGGVGLEVDGRGDRLVVIAPIEGSPAARAGLRSGDVIVAVDGDDVVGQPLEKVVKRMRGAPGSKVKVTVSRESGRGTAAAGQPDAGIAPSPDAGAAERTGQTLTFELVREVIKVSSVAYKLLDGNVAYLRLKQFQERTHDETLAAIAKMRGQAKGGLAGVVLDVRSNPGGLVDEATEIADEFLASGGIYSMRHRGKIIEDLQASSGGALVDVPVVALVNEWSASASELLVGALQDNKRATVVGAPSFGKGSVQSVLPLPNGSGLKLTTARYYTPSGHAIQADGIHPDVVVELPRGLDAPKITRERDLPGSLPPEASGDGGARGATPPARVVAVDAGAAGEDAAALAFARDVPSDPTTGKDVVLRVGYELVRKQIAERGAR